MFNVWNSIFPEDVKKVIEHANAQRYSVDSQKQKDQVIKVTEEWMNELDAMPFVSKRKGKMVHLLKQKSKVRAEMKPRVKYEPFDFMAAKRRNFGNAAEKATFQQNDQEKKRKQDAPKKITPTILEKFDEEMKKDNK